MPTLQTIFIFMGVSIVANMTPGPSMLYVLSQSLGRGKRVVFSQKEANSRSEAC